MGAAGGLTGLAIGAAITQLGPTVDGPPRPLPALARDADPAASPAAGERTADPRRGPGERVLYADRRRHTIADPPPATTAATTSASTAEAAVAAVIARASAGAARFAGSAASAPMSGCRADILSHDITIAAACRGPRAP